MSPAAGATQAARRIYRFVAMAKKPGATRDEIKDTILITLSVCGLKGVASCLPVALEVFDKTE